MGTHRSGRDDVAAGDVEHVVPLRPYGLGATYRGMRRVVELSPSQVVAAALIGFAISAAVAVAAAPASRITKSLDDDGHTRLRTHAYLGHELIAEAGILGALAVAALVVPLALRLVAGRDGDALDDVATRGWRAAGGYLVHLLLSAPLAAAGLATHVGDPDHQGQTVAFAGISILVLPLFLWIYVAVSLTPVVLVAEGGGLVTALRRSWRLVRGSWWRVLGLSLGFEIVRLVGGGALGVYGAVRTADLTVGASLSSPTRTAAVLTALLALLATPMLVLGQTLLYVDLRCRREGLAWSLDAARRGDDRDVFGPHGVYAPPELPSLRSSAAP